MYKQAYSSLEYTSGDLAMQTTFLVVSAIVSVSVVVFLLIVRFLNATATEGFQDENGFHEIRNPEKKPSNVPVGTVLG